MADESQLEGSVEKEEKKSPEAASAKDDKKAEASQTDSQAGEDKEKPGSEGEPGGSDGQAVYQRKLHRENKRLQEELHRVELQRAQERARLEERLRFLEEEKKKSEKPTRYTPEQIQAAIDRGEVTAAQGYAYLAKIEALEVHEQKERERTERESRERPRKEAVEEIKQYVDVHPWLLDDADQRTREIGIRFRQLISTYGLPNNEVTQAVAIREVLGPLDRNKRKREIDNLTSRNSTHAETGAGGNAGRSQGDATSKVPKDLIEGWRKMGASDEQIKKYAEHHVDKMNARKARYSL